MSQPTKGTGITQKQMIFFSGILILLLSLQCCRGNSNPSIDSISPKAAEEVVTGTDPEYRDVNFGGKFILLGANLIKGTEGVRLELVWKSFVDQPLVYFNAIHLMDRQGSILSTLDYPQDKGKTTVKAGTLWKDKIDIPGARVENTALIGIGIYSVPDVQLLSVDKGPRDGVGKRLLIPLPSIRIVDSSAATELVNRTSPEYRDITFGDKFVLLGLQFVKTGEGLQLQCAWKSIGEQRLSFFYALHLLDDKGKVISTLDHPQDEGKTLVKANTLWMDKVDIPRSKLERLAFVGIGIYSLPGAQLLPIGKGSREWEGKRLLIVLPKSN